MPNSSTDSGTLVLQEAKESLGFLPNLFKELSEHNPAVAKTYLATANHLEEGVLDGKEREVVMLAVSRYNDCHYCTNLHMKAGLSAGFSKDTLEAINSGGLPDDERLQVLVQATRLLLDKRGWLDKDDLDTLRERGLSSAELYEINALIGIKTISNFVNHVAQTKVDPELQID